MRASRASLPKTLIKMTLFGVSFCEKVTLFGVTFTIGLRRDTPGSREPVVRRRPICYAKRK